MGRNGFAPRTILDIGACRGDWTNLCRIVFPEAKILMLEPLEEKREALELLTILHQNVDFKPVLLGSSARKNVRFYEQDSLSSIFPLHDQGWKPTATLEMKTLDSVVSRTPFATSDLIKIHVQGAELEVLRGAEKTLERAQAVFVLASLIELYEGSPLFHEVQQFMVGRGFRLFDLAHFYHRELDGALAQIDAVFLKSTSPLLAVKGW